MGRYRKDPNRGFFNDSDKEEPTGEETGSVSIPEGYKLVQEAKSARIQLLVSPTMKDNVKRAADARGISVNELFNKVMAEYLKTDRR